MKETEKYLKLSRKILFVFIIISAMFAGCKDDPVPEPEPEPDGKEKASALTIKVNQFFKDVMEDVYLWYNTLPTIDINYEFDSEAYFEKLLYSEDKWSFVTDDIEALEGSFEGKETSFGWSLAFGRFSDTQTIFALVEYVYPKTPAALAGFKRGDLIYQMNSADITDANYMDLLTATNLSCTYGQYVSGSGITNSKTASLTALELNLNPVQFTNIIEHGGKKIGYLFYAQYISNYNSSLDSVIQYFMANQVTDVVLDLRYNPGGTTTAAQHLCSSLAPLDVVNGQKTLVKFQWNDKYQDYWESQNATEQLGVNFADTVKHKMGLNKLWVITGQGTASASELTITGLKPYMTVTTVGETTYGKYTASITLKPEDFYESISYYKEIDNWGVQPIILKYANSLGVTDFKEGFAPDIAVEDDLFSTIPLGNKEEAMLKKTLENITGVEILATKSAARPSNYKIIDRGFSKFDKNKREVLFEGFDKTLLRIE
ncbi:MAG: S41 family peptidase [Draconibacterium sp.]